MIKTCKDANATEIHAFMNEKYKTFKALWTTYDDAHICLGVALSISLLMVAINLSIGTKESKIPMGLVVMSLVESIVTKVVAFFVFVVFVVRTLMRVSKILKEQSNNPKLSIVDLSAVMTISTLIVVPFADSFT